MSLLFNLLFRKFDEPIKRDARTIWAAGLVKFFINKIIFLFEFFEVLAHFRVLLRREVVQV